MALAENRLPREFLDSSPRLARGDVDALQNTLSVEGYLFFRGLLPRVAVEQVRRDLLGVAGQFGWLVPGQDPLGGRLDLARLAEVPSEEMRDDIGVSAAAYAAAQRLESVHRLPHHPDLLRVFSLLLGGEVLVHPRHIVRMITGHPCMVPTPPHQDFPLIQGTAQTYTCWFPIGDCPRSHGGLTVLRNSHQLGCLPVVPARGAGGIAVPLCPGETDWVEGDFVAGDALVFPSFTVHKALRSLVRDEIRLSFDVRYQRAEEPVEEKSLLPHCDLGWDQLYAGWERDDLKYYWEKQRLQLVPWIPGLMEPGRRIC